MVESLNAVVAHLAVLRSKLLFKLALRAESAEVTFVHEVLSIQLSNKALTV